jgi:Pycsar effector protein
MKMTTQDIVPAVRAAISATETTSIASSTADRPPAEFGRGFSEQLNQFIWVADAKAAVLVGANLTIAGLLLINRSAAFWPFIANVIAVVLLGISALLGLTVLYPRRAGEGKSILFWEDIYKMSLSEYKAKVERLDPNQVENEYIIHNFYLSKVLHKKYFVIKWGIVLFIAGTLCTFISVALVA